MKRTKHFKSTEVHVLHNEEFKEKGGKEWILNTVFSSNYLKVSNQKKEAFIKEQSNYGYQMLYVSSILYLSFFPSLSLFLHLFSTSFLFLYFLSCSLSLCFFWHAHAISFSQLFQSLFFLSFDFIQNIKK